jgi:hypothetical protein
MLDKDSLAVFHEATKLADLTKELLMSFNSRLHALERRDASLLVINKDTLDQEARRATEIIKYLYG